MTEGLLILVICGGMLLFGLLKEAIHEYNSNANSSSSKIEEISIEEQARQAAEYEEKKRKEQEILDDFFKACYAGDIEHIKKLIKNGLDINTPNFFYGDKYNTEKTPSTKFNISYNSTAIEIAYFNKIENLFSFLIENGADSQPLLARGIKYEDIDTCKKALELGCDPNKPLNFNILWQAYIGEETEGPTPLSKLFTNAIFVMEENKLEKIISIADLLIKYGADVNKCNNERCNGYSIPKRPIDWFSNSDAGNMPVPSKKLFIYLINRGTDLTMKTYNAENGLSGCCYEDYELIELLKLHEYDFSGDLQIFYRALSYTNKNETQQDFEKRTKIFGFDINYKDDTGKTPLMKIASTYGLRPENISNKLLNYTGIKLNETDNSGKTALMLFFEYMSKNQKNDFYYKNLKETEQRMIKAGCKYNIREL